MNQKNSVKRNIIYNFVYQILILILPFITAPYLSRTLGAEGLGIFSFSQSIALYFTYITMLGLSNYGNRTIAAVQDDFNERSKIFFEIYSMQLLTFLISIIAYVFYAFFFAVDKVAAVIMIIWVASAAFDINWFFFGMEQFKLTVLRNTAIKIITVICIFVFVKCRDDVYKYIFIMSAGTAISQICLWPYMRKFVCFVAPTWKGMARHFKPNAKLFIPVIAASVYNLMDKVMLGYMSTMDDVGFYENAEKIIKMVQSLIVAVGTVMLPRVTALVSKSQEEKSEKYFELSMEAALIYVSLTIFGIFAAGELFTQIYFGDGFEQTGFLLKLLIVTVFFFGVGNVLRTQYLIPKGNDQIYIRSAILGAGLNLTINLILIPRLGSVGASIATIFAEVSVCCYQFYSVRKEIQLKKYLVKSAIYLLFGLIMYILLIRIPANNIYDLFKIAVLGGLIYVCEVGGFFVARKYYKKRKEL